MVQIFGMFNEILMEGKTLLLLSLRSVSSSFFFFFFVRIITKHYFVFFNVPNNTFLQLHEDVNIIVVMQTTFIVH